MAPQRIFRDLQPLLLSGQLQNIPKGQIIFSTDNKPSHIYLLKSGFVKRYLISSNGRLGIHSIQGHGDILPLTSVYKILLGQDTYMGPEIFYYETMCNSEIYAVEGEQFREAVNNNPSLYKQLFSIAGKRLQLYIQLVENMELRNSYRRLAHQLAYFAREFGEPKGSATTILIPLTHQDLADILSITRETVSLGMERLQNERLIRHDKNIVVYSLARLEKEALS